MTPTSPFRDSRLIRRSWGVVLPLYFWVATITAPAFYDPFQPVPRGLKFDPSPLPQQVSLDTGYLEDVMAFLHQSRKGIPAVRILLARSEDLTTFQLQGMAVGLYGKRLWVGYEYISPTEVIATFQWQKDW